jgi:hypothetical protein
VSDRDVTLESFGTPGGPSVLPGRYTLALDVDGKKLTKPLVVELDPRYDIAHADLVAQLGTGTELRELTTRVNAVVSETNDLLRQLEALHVQLAGDSTRTSRLASANARATPQALAAIDSATRELRHFRDSVLTRPAPVMGYRQYPRLAEEVNTVSGMVWRGISPPTAGEKLRLTELVRETDAAQSRLDNIVNTRIAKVNELLGGTPHIIAPPSRRVVQ